MTKGWDALLIIFQIGLSSNWHPVLHGVPQGSVLRSLSFSHCINDLGVTIHFEKQERVSETS